MNQQINTKQIYNEYMRYIYIYIMNIYRFFNIKISLGVHINDIL